MRPIRGFFADFLVPAEAWACVGQKCGMHKKVSRWVMKRLVLLLGSGWALIYVTNHVLLPSTPSKTKPEVATAPEPISADRRIDSWGAYLPQFGSEPDAHRPPPPSHLRQPREVAALQGDAAKSNNETSSTNSAKTIPQVRTGTTLGRLDSPPGLKPLGAPLRKAKKARVPATNKGQVAQATTDQNPGWRTGSERKHRGVGLFMFAPPGF
jgi:hypothetical protein